ncbi:MAG: NEW3 domain-containing protein, partial [Candidatus Pacearchaeota archaeon]
MTNIRITGITPEQGRSFSLNFTLNNMGNARANNTKLNISLPTGWSASPSEFIYGIVLKNTSKSNETIISIPAGTLPGTYKVNLTVYWDNLDATSNSNKTTVSVEVVSRFSWAQTPASITKEVV